VSAAQVERTCFYNLTSLIKSLFVFEKESFSYVSASLLKLEQEVIKFQL
jgi:hypothetical protein